MGSDIKKGTPDSRGGSLYMSPRAKKMFKTSTRNPIQSSIDNAFFNRGKSEIKKVPGLYTSNTEAGKKAKGAIFEKWSRVSHDTFMATHIRARKKDK